MATNCTPTGSPLTTANPTLLHNGILFNHVNLLCETSRYHPQNSPAIANIAQGLESCLYLVLWIPWCDQGHAKDYEMQWMMPNRNNRKISLLPSAFSTRSVRQFVETAAHNWALTSAGRRVGREGIVASVNQNDALALNRDVIIAATRATSVRQKAGNAAR